MKKTIFYFLAFIVLFGISTGIQANDEEITTSNEGITVSESTEAGKMLDRLYEIKELDFKELTSAEKKELRKEVRSIRSDLKEMVKSDSESVSQSASDAMAEARERGGFYISTGAAIIIVLLLILLL